MRASLVPHLVAIAAAGVAVATCVRAETGRGRVPKADALAAEPIGPKADDVARGFFGKLPGKTKGYACFERVYDQAHLIRHPLQRVGSMTMLIRGETIPEDPVANYSFVLRMTYKNAPRRFLSSGYCGHPATTGASGLRCGIDCDGGALDVALAADTRSTLVSLERIAIWSENADAADDERRAHLEAGADDKSFRLQRVAADRCTALANEDEVAEIGRAR